MASDDRERRLASLGSYEGHVCSTVHITTFTAAGLTSSIDQISAAITRIKDGFRVQTGPTLHG